MRAFLIAGVIVLALAPQVPGLAQAPAPQGPKVQITFEPNGMVSLVANSATPREILAEWTRVGGSTFVNAERLQGAPMTLQYTHEAESEVIRSVLRQAAGYVLGPRRAGTTGASGVEVVYILATSNPTASAYVPQPTYQPQITTVGAPDDEIPPAQAGRGLPGPQPGPGPQPPPATPLGSGTPGVSSVVVPVVPVTTPVTTSGSGTSGS